MERFLVTGAMGFVGSHLCEYLLKKGKTVYGIDITSRYQPLLNYDNFIFVQDSIKNYDLVRTMIDKVDCVCHLAGIAEPDQYSRYPLRIIDVTAVDGLKLIDMCRITGKLFFLTSTSEIYGKSTKIPFKEDDDRVLGSTKTKRWNYSTAKALLEHYLDACALTKELDHIIVRLFNVYGPRLKGRVASIFLENALQGKDLIIHGDGKQTRCFTYIDDVIEAFDLLLHNPKCYNQVFNIGNPEEITIIDLAEKILKLGGFSSKIRFVSHCEYYGRSHEEIRRRVPDVSKIREFTGWEPHTSIDKGFLQTIQYIKGEIDTLKKD